MTLLTVIFLSLAPIDVPTMQAAERIEQVFSQLHDARDARVFSEVGMAVLNALQRRRCGGDRLSSE